METCRLDKPTINIFEILHLRKERYHNAMLAWLLDPDQSHGFDDAFLSRFLERVGVKNYTRDDFQRIWPEYTLATRRLDIFIETRTQKIYIENKVLASSIDDQELRDQVGDISKNAGDKEGIHVFIVPRQGNIQSSTQTVVNEHDICVVEWADIVRLLEALLVGNEVADPHVEAVLEQYLDYVKEHIAHMFDGFDVEDMRKYIEAAKIIWQFEKRENQTKRQIEGFLTIVAEEVLSRLSGVVSSEWGFQIKRRTWAAVSRRVCFASEHCSDLDFFIEIYYAPQYHADGLLRARVGASLYGGDRISQLAGIVHDKSSRLAGQDTKRYTGNSIHEYTERGGKVQWSDLEQWPSLRDRLVERAVAWMTELIPVIEKTLQPLQKKQRAKK